MKFPGEIFNKKAETMDMGRPLGLFLLLWMVLRVDGEKNIDFFIPDVITTFGLTMPTIIYDGADEAPEICYTNQGVLCLPSENQEKESTVESETDLERKSTQESATESESKFVKSVTESSIEPKSNATETNDGMQSIVPSYISFNFILFNL